MTIDATDYCSNVCDDETYRNNVLARLDQIVELLGGDEDDDEGGGGEDPSAAATTWYPLTIVDFGDLTAAFLEFLENEESLKYLQILNDTNEPIEVSFNGTDVHGFVAVNGSWTHNFGSNSAFEQGSVYLRYAEDAPADGDVKIMAYY